MTLVSALKYSSFTTEIGKGNPAGVFLRGDLMTEEEMQLAARKIGYNECVFVCPSDVADLRLRFFMPGKETTLCGHATVAAVSALMEGKNTDCTLRAETSAGVLKLDWLADRREVKMEQANARFEAFDGDVGALLASLGLPGKALDERMPVVYGSTGSWTLMLPIRGREWFEGMKPCNERFPEILSLHTGASVHPFTAECVHKGYAFHARHFSSPFSGTVEDPVTGTAAGVSGAYYLQYLSPERKADLLIEQGLEIGKDGTIRVIAERKPDGAIAVSILGRAVAEGTVEVGL